MVLLAVGTGVSVCVEPVAVTAVSLRWVVVTVSVYDAAQASGKSGSIPPCRLWNWGRIGFGRSASGAASK
jgi:hypothetical protein